MLVEDITCALNDGVIEIYNVQGGWGGYTYFVGTAAPAGPGDYVTSPRFENLGPGTYQAWVRDSQGCDALILDNIVLADPALIVGTLQINQPNCTPLSGEIEVTGVSGGQGSNYVYQLILDGADFGAPQATGLFSNLGAGSYQVRISDQWGCATVVGPVVLDEPIDLVGVVDKPLDCSPNPDGEISVVATGGSGNFNYTITYPDGFTTATNATGVFTGLNQVGTYVVVVADLDTDQSSLTCRPQVRE